MNSLDYDDSTAFLGDWGPFQSTVFTLLCLSIIPNGFTGLSMVFMGDTPAHHCLIPEALNITDEWRNASIPLDEDEDSRLTKCSRHRVDIVKNYSDRGLLPWVDVNVSSIPREDCMDGWEYDKGTYISTIVTEVRFDAFSLLQPNVFIQYAKRKFRFAVSWGIRAPGAGCFPVGPLKSRSGSAPAFAPLVGQMSRFHSGECFLKVNSL